MKKWLIIALIAFLAVSVFSFKEHRDIKALEAENKRLSAELAQQVQKIKELQKTNDTKIKEAGRNAADKVAALSDDVLLDAVNELIDESRSRNEKRRWDF